MFVFIVVIIILACIVLGFFVLIQDSKGGGLASNFAFPINNGVVNYDFWKARGNWEPESLFSVSCAFMTKSEFTKRKPVLNPKQTNRF